MWPCRMSTAASKCFCDRRVAVHALLAKSRHDSLQFMPRLAPALCSLHAFADSITHLLCRSTSRSVARSARSVYHKFRHLPSILIFIFVFVFVAAGNVRHI